MMGAQPLAISLAYVIEEGLPLEELRRRSRPRRPRAAAGPGARIVTGDTKVVGRGAADRLFVNTAGIGLVPGRRRAVGRPRAAGDAILLSGPIGLHGVAIMSVREGLEFEVEIASDTQALNGLVAAMLAVEPGRPRPARPDPGRPLVGAQRDRRGVAASAWCSTSRRSRSRARSAPPARCSASTRSTSPTRASSWRSCRRHRPRPCRRHAGPAGGAAPRGSASRRRPPGHGHHPHHRRQRADRRHAGRGAAAPDLLSGGTVVRAGTRPRKGVGIRQRSRAEASPPVACRSAGRRSPGLRSRVARPRGRGDMRSRDPAPPGSSPAPHGSRRPRLCPRSRRAPSPPGLRPRTSRGAPGPPATSATPTAARARRRDDDGGTGAGLPAHLTPASTDAHDLPGTAHPCHSALDPPAVGPEWAIRQ